MESTTDKTVITVATTIEAPLEKVWVLFTEPAHIEKWYNASPDWHTPSATNDLKIGGQFDYRMEAKDGSFGFNFIGAYTDLKNHEFMHILLGDNRTVSITFNSDGHSTTVTEVFEPEQLNSHDLQKGGWQAILDNFKHYVENN